MRIVVTGSNGFIGRHIAQSLRQAGHEVIGIDLKRNHIDTIYLLDLSDKNVIHFIASLEPEILFHLASVAREGASIYQPCLITRSNIMSYVNTLTGCIKCPKFKKVIFFSSMSVYGDQVPPFDESIPKKPVDIYGVNKAACEDITKMMCEAYDKKYTIIRPHNVFGEYQCLSDRYRNVIGIFMNQIMRKEPLTVFGDGNQSRAFSYIGDSLPAYLHCLNEADGEIINIGGTQTYKITDIANLVISAMRDGFPDIKYLPNRYAEVKDAYCTYQKSMNVLKYSDVIGVEKGIFKMAEWAKSEGPQKWNSTDEMELIHFEKTPEHWI